MSFISCGRRTVFVIGGDCEACNFGSPHAQYFEKMIVIGQIYRLIKAT